jgi:hypothetical protein
MNNTINVTDETYSIPRRFRIAENMHIVFWLIKDMSWAMKFRWLGIGMFIPTLVLALLITWQTRRVRSELYHNLAVTCWIIANGYWMICEFYWESLDFLRYFSVIPFSLGLISIAYYYISEFTPKRTEPNSDLAA